MLAIYEWLNLNLGKISVKNQTCVNVLQAIPTLVKNQLSETCLCYRVSLVPATQQST